jgi:hypothetical protein
MNATTKTEAEKKLEEREKAIEAREKAVDEREKALDKGEPTAVEEDLTPTPTQAENDAMRLNPGDYQTRDLKAD